MISFEMLSFAENVAGQDVSSVQTSLTDNRRNSCGTFRHAIRISVEISWKMHLTCMFGDA
ncbi:hypothetical protein DPMN_055606 [Dreissena polymorpha]|uniref:Uncharacterized protein n=1 Tax=Dreissena polymorpha TaxID=45954 RepID=A0A9D4CRP3_DREPO|nr:hypothetical protein DPMN_055606 [Dreissena polymorpha]